MANAKTIIKLYGRNSAIIQPTSNARDIKTFETI